MCYLVSVFAIIRIITNAQNQLTKLHIIFKTKNNLEEKIAKKPQISPKLAR